MTGVILAGVHSFCLWCVSVIDQDRSDLDASSPTLNMKENGSSSCDRSSLWLRGSRCDAQAFFFPHFDHPQESNKHTCWWLYFPDVLCLCTYWFPKQKWFPFLIQTIEMRRTMRWCVWDVKCKTVSYVWICVCVIAWLPLLGQASVSFGWHCASGKVCFVAFWGTKLRFLMWESLTVYQSICFRVC